MYQTARVHWREPVLFALNSTRQKCDVWTGPKISGTHALYPHPRTLHTPHDSLPKPIIFYPGHDPRPGHDHQANSTRLLGPGKRPGSSLKSASVCLFVFVFRCSKSALLRCWLVESRLSWADWFARAVFQSRALALAKSLFSGINGSTTVMALACQVGPFHLMLTQINSEMNFIAKNKCPDSQKLDTRCRGENLIAISDMCQDQEHVYSLHSLFLIYSLWGKKSVRKSYFHSETFLFLRLDNVQ